MNSVPKEKRKKPVFGPMKIKVDKADDSVVPEKPLDLAIDRFKAAPQAFDGSLVAEPSDTAKAAAETDVEAAEVPKVSEPIAENESETTLNELAVKEEESEPQEEQPLIEGIPKTKTQALMEHYQLQEDSEVHSDPYRIKTPPPAWVPPSRRGFTQFFDATFAEEGEHAAQFVLQPKLLGQKDLDACRKQRSDVVESFLYQQFVREYLRSATPYRGLLVYHGLGSGKTCSAITAAEALLGTSNKKIIIMTPGSIRPNFQSQIQFCGFRHYRLNNHWIPIPLADTKKGPDASVIENFALNVLRMSPKFFEGLRRAKKNIWLPDFDKEPNYYSLSADFQAEIKEQITDILENRIEFINYNGVTAKKLQDMLCKAAANPEAPGPFDNAVIVIDEIHNLSRLMRGKLHYYMEQTATKRGKPRLVPPEPVTPERWQPRYCNLNLKYRRAFMLYRLIAEARNSKVIGLSGTPLLNFPDELAPLMNMIGGYTHAFKMTATDKSESSKAIMKDLANKHPCVDLFEATPGQLDIQYLMTTFPAGYVKVTDGQGDFIGVREAEVDESKTTKQVADEIYEAAKKAGVTFKGEPVLQSYPILPVNPMEFDKYFVNSETMTPEHVNVLKKRIYGLVSYYKGSSEDLMPAIKEDTVVKIRFSDYALNYYTIRRLREIAESPKELMSREEVDPFDELNSLSQAKNPSNYRFNSRASCNFAFPQSIRRPYKSLKKEEDLAGEVDEPGATSIVTDEAFDADVGADEAAAVVAEDAQADGAGEEDVTEDEPAVAKARQDFLDRADAELKAAGGPSLKEENAEEEKQVRLEPYKVRLQKALSTLRAQASKFLRLDGEPDSNLEKFSPKFAALLRNIDNPDVINGSSLVYSQFKSAEGLGIFGYAMEANGYTHITFGGSKTDPEFSAEAEASLRKGPYRSEGTYGQKRFMFYTGEGSNAERKIMINLFNGNLKDLPAKMQRVLLESGFTEEMGNKKGEICKVIGITGAGAEGLSLKCVRGVHILEPYWNDVRHEQVKGRAVRICSHESLPPEERTVSVFTYIMEFTEEDIKSKRVIESLKVKDDKQTSDQHVLGLATKKKSLNAGFLKILKEVAIDCPLNAAENEKDLRCYEGVDGSPKETIVQPSLEADIQAGEIEERLNTKKGKATAATNNQVSVPGKKVEQVKIGGINYYLEKDPEANEPNIYLAYELTDIKRKRPIYRIKKDPATGKLSGKKL